MTEFSIIAEHIADQTVHQKELARALTLLIESEGILLEETYFSAADDIKRVIEQLRRSI